MTESNAVQSPSGRAGAEALSGYAVSEVTYTAEGDILRTVSFAVDHEARLVQIRLRGGEWHDCSVSSGSKRVICAGLSERVEDADQLAVVASA